MEDGGEGLGGRGMSDKVVRAVTMTGAWIVQSLFGSTLSSIFAGVWGTEAARMGSGALALISDKNRNLHLNGTVRFASTLSIRLGLICKVVNNLK